MLGLMGDYELIRVKNCWMMDVIIPLFNSFIELKVANSLQQFRQVV